MGTIARQATRLNHGLQSYLNSCHHVILIPLSLSVDIEFILFLFFIFPLFLFPSLASISS